MKGLFVRTRRAAPAVKRRGVIAGLAVVLAALVGVVPASAVTPKDSRGSEFWLAFPGNIGADTINLFISGDTATSGTVEIPGMSFSTTFTVTPGTVTTVVLPVATDISTSDAVESKGVHVTAGAEVSVYGLDRVRFSSDAFLGLPVDTLGTEYIMLGYKNSNVLNGSEFAIVAAQPATTVTITPSVTTGSHAAGVPYTVALGLGQTYQLRNTDSAPADLSGTIVTSDKPIAAFAGHQCANVPPGALYCDYIVEQMFPATSWGKNFVTMPLATRTKGDTFRVLAGTNSTTVKIDGATVATLNRGQLYEQVVTAPANITADKPVLVAQYSNGTTFDGVTSDPFEVLVPPFEQFLAKYTITTPATGFSTNFINIVAPNAAVGTISLDGTAVPASSYTAIGTSGFSGAQVSINLGSHTLASTQPFGITVYGFADYDSYGYPGGLTLSEIARVTSLVLAPKTATNPINTQQCLTATTRDQTNDPISGVRVDFAVTGVNPTTGFANTEANGSAQFCYTGTTGGSDTVTATVGTLSDRATVQWTTAKPGGAFALEATGTLPVGQTPDAVCPPGATKTLPKLDLLGLGTATGPSASCATDTAGTTVAASSATSLSLFAGLLRIEAVQSQCTSKGGVSTGTSKVGTINGRAIGNVAGSINVAGVGQVFFNETTTGPGGALTQNAIRIVKPATLGLLGQQIIVAGCYFK